MRYCFWLSELPVDSISHPNTADLARLSQMGLPVLPAWAVLPTVPAMLFSDPDVRSVIKREAKLVRLHPAAVGSAVQAVRQRLLTTQLPADVKRELGKMLSNMRQQLMLPEGPVKLSFLMEDIKISRHIEDSDSLEAVLKELYALSVEERHFLNRERIEATEAIIRYVSTDEVYGIGHLRDDLRGDETIIQISVTGNLGDTYRIDRKSGKILTAPLEPERFGLSEAKIRDLARLVAQAQDALPEPREFTWQRLHGRIWVDSIQSLEKAKAPQHRTVLAAHSGTARGLVRRIQTVADRKRLQAGEIVVIDGLTVFDKEWLAPAAAIVTAYGSYYGVPAQIGRQLGIPVLSGIDPAQIDRFINGQLIFVDGNAGTVGSVGSPAVCAGTATKLIVRSEGLTSPDFNVDGVLSTGSTGLLSLHALHPHEILRRGRVGEYVELLAEELQRAAQSVYPKPYFYRFHDGHVPGTKRGLHAALERAEWLETELKMLDRTVRGASNVIPVTPLLHDLAEVVRFRQRAEHYPDLLRRLWITAGTPALAIQAEELAISDVSGICLDLAHLAELTLGIIDASRADLVRIDHPAVLQQAEYLMGAALQQGIRTMVDTDGVSMSRGLIEQLVTSGADYLVVTESAYLATEQMVDVVERHLWQEYRLDAARSIC